MKIYIRGFAELQREIERKLSERTDEVIEHLGKCYLQPNHSAINHWKQEIFRLINRIDKLKNGKKFPTAKQIYSWTYGKKQDLVTDIRWFSKFVNGICEDHSIEIDKSPAEFMMDFDSVCVEYFQWLANELSQSGILNRSEVYAELNYIFNL